MTGAALTCIKELMAEAGVPYRFERWNSAPPDPYFVGEYMETPTMDRYENGHQESTFILRGFTKGSWSGLEEAKASIERVMARTDILPNGNGIAIFYDSGAPVPTGDAELKSIKINLTIQEWSVK